MVHSEPPAAEGRRQAIERRLRWNGIVPRSGEDVRSDCPGSAACGFAPGADMAQP